MQLKRCLPPTVKLCITDLTLTVNEFQRVGAATKHSPSSGVCFNSGNKK